MTNEEIEAAKEHIQAALRPITPSDYKEPFAATVALDALCAAAGENAVMRELCEAANSLSDVLFYDLPMNQNVRRLLVGIDAYLRIKESSHAQQA